MFADVKQMSKIIGCFLHEQVIGKSLHLFDGNNTQGFIHVLIQVKQKLKLSHTWTVLWQIRKS